MQIEFKLPDMSCGHCSAAVKKAVQSADAQATVDVDLAARTARVETTQGREAIAHALEEAGYPPA